MAHPDNTPFDPQEVYVFLRPEESSILAVTALLHGPMPPRGVSFRTWSEARKGVAECISWAEFGAIADGCPTLMEDLHQLRSARREVA